MEQSFSNIVKTIVFFAVLSFLTGVVKNQFILNSFDQDIRTIIGITSYTSMIVSLLISCIIFGLIAYICFIILDLTRSKIDLPEFSSAFRNFIYILMSFEIIKTILVFVILDKEFVKIAINNGFEENLKNTNWFFYNNLTEIISVLIGILVFTFSFKKISNINKLLQVFFLSIIIGVCIFLSNLKWF